MRTWSAAFVINVVSVCTSSLLLAPRPLVRSLPDEFANLAQYEARSLLRLKPVASLAPLPIVAIELIWIGSTTIPNEERRRRANGSEMAAKPRSLAPMTPPMMMTMAMMQCSFAR